MDRRTYLRQMALVTGGILVVPRILVSCSDNLKQIDLASSLEPFRTLEEIRHFVRLSGGHLNLEVERLIKNKKAENIYNFINDRIVTIPGSPKTITSNAYEVRWGQEGMLRCGKGTLREKSDLLFFMLSEAGFSPTYHRSNFLMTPSLVTHVFCRKWNDNNEIEVDEAYLNKWDDTLSPTDSEAITKTIDSSKGKVIVDELISKLPEGFEEELPHIDWLDVDGLEAPVVRIQINGENKDLNFVEDKTFSEFTENAQSLHDLDIDEVNSKLDKVRVIVHATFSDQMNKPVEIVRGEWELSKLLGNQIAIQCMSTLPQEVMLQTPIKDIQQFVPVLSLQNPAIPEEEKINYSFKGVGFDLMGNTFQEDGDGEIRMNDLKLNGVEKSDTSKIKSLKVELLDNEYPTIKLKCLPLNASGEPVLGLSGSAFDIVDQHKQQFPVVLQNSLTTRVLVFFDSTASMPYPYAANDIPEETISMIYTEFEKIYPSVVFETKMFQLEFLNDLSALELKQYDHILCIGDGEAFDDVTSEELRNIVGENSISYHYIKNGSSRQSNEQSKRCFTEANYLFFDIENLESSIVQIGEDLSKNPTYPYLLSYEAPYEGDDMIHPVIIGITGNSNVSPEKERYVVNRERIYDAERYPCGISITLDWDEGYSHESIIKHVAGFNPEIEDVVLPKHKEEVRAFALGTHRFFFEPDKATLPVLLDESLTSQLSVASFFEDVKELKEDQLEQINKFQVLPAAGLSVFAPLPEPGNDWVTFENNFQTCLYSEFVNFDVRRSFKKVDVWETSDVRTLAITKKESFVKTLEATSLLALSESQLFQESTFSKLKNKSLLVYTSGAIDFQTYPDWHVFYNQSYRNHLLYDSSFDTAAYWKINKSTGALIGIMPDGSGGGIEQAIEHNLKIIDSYAAAYNKAAAPFMSDPLAFGTVTMYGQFLARLYGLVCIAVLSLDAAKLPAKSRKAMGKLAYNVIKSFAFAKFSKLKNFEKILDKLFDPGWPDV